MPLITFHGVLSFFQCCCLSLDVGTSARWSTSLVLIVPTTSRKMSASGRQGSNVLLLCVQCSQTIGKTTLPYTVNYTLYMKRMKAMSTFWEEAVTEYKHLLLILFDEIKVAAPRLSSCNFHQYFYPTCLITRHPTAFWSSTRWFSNLKAGTNCSSFPRNAFCFVPYPRLS